MVQVCLRVQGSAMVEIMIIVFVIASNLPQICPSFWQTLEVPTVPHYHYCHLLLEVARSCNQSDSVGH